MTAIVSDMAKFKIEADEAIKLLEAAIDGLEKMDGLIAQDPAGGSKNSAYNARITKELLYVAHLCKMAETEVLTQYHQYKGAGIPGRR